MDFGLIFIFFGSEKKFKKKQITGLTPEIVVVNYHMSAMLQFIDRYML